MTETRYPLGRVVEHDPRSLRFYPADLAPELRSVTWRTWGPRLDQQSVGACTGFAMAQALNTVPLRHGRKLLVAADALDLYHNATILDSFDGVWPPLDSGSSGLAVAKAAKQAGYISAYRHARPDEALAALVLSPVIIGVNWYESMFWVDPDGYVVPKGSIAGGHEVALTAIDAKRKRVTLLNNWGPSWGRNGKAYLRFSDLAELLMDNGDCVVPVL